MRLVDYSHDFPTKTQEPVRIRRCNILPTTRPRRKGSTSQRPFQCFPASYTCHHAYGSNVSTTSCTGSNRLEEDILLRWRRRTSWWQTYAVLSEHCVSALEYVAFFTGTPVADLEARLDSFMQDTDDLRKRLEALERTSLRAEAEQMLNQVQDIDGVKVVAGRSSATGPEGMREMGDFLKTRLDSMVMVLGAVVNGNPILVAMVTPDLVSRGLHAGNIARDTAKVMGGGGGGQAEMAQAGGREANKLEEGLRGVPELVRQALKG